MDKFLETCEKMFNSKNFYEILDLAHGAPINEVKKKYYHMARQYHPDKVEGSKKEDASEKFSLLTQIYHILVDKSSKVLYDTTGEVRLANGNNTHLIWMQYVKPVLDDDLNNAKDKYVGSKQEEEDIICALKGQSSISITHLMNHIPFMRIEDEQRIILLLKKLMADGKLPKCAIRKYRP